MKSQTRVRSTAAPSNTWHAVEVVSPTDYCAAATGCRGKRFLSAETPRLPLPACDRPESCPCRYRHHQDRRAGPRRSSESGRPPRSGVPSVEQRVRRGRRQTDL